MAIRITCPACKTSLKLDDDARGTKVECSECDKVLSIPAANGVKKKAAPPPDEPDEDVDQDEEERPAKKKKKKSKKGAASSPMLLVGAAAVVVILLAVGGVSAILLLRPDPAKQNQQAKVDLKDKKPNIDQKPVIDQQPFVPVVKEKKDDAFEAKNPTGGIQFSKKGSGTLISNIRGAAYVTERKNELGNLGKFFILYANDNPNANNRTLASFLETFKRDAPKLHDLVREENYVINLRASLAASNGIIAYEWGMYPNGYLCVRVDGSVDYVPQDEWKTALGK